MQAQPAQPLAASPAGATGPAASDTGQESPALGPDIRQTDSAMSADSQSSQPPKSGSGSQHRLEALQRSASEASSVQSSSVCPVLCCLVW